MVGLLSRRVDPTPRIFFIERRELEDDVVDGAGRRVRVGRLVVVLN